MASAFRGPQQPATPAATEDNRVEHVRTFWEMLTPSGRLIACALYRTSSGLELRAGVGEGDRLLSELVHSQHAAEVFAATWRKVAETQGYRDSRSPRQFKPEG